MSKKVIVLSTSLRSSSNSELLAKSFVEGAKESGNEVEFITLKNKDIHFCIGCLACQKTGHCVIKDDVTDIQLTTQSIDTEDKVVKNLSFENVHMVKGKRTTYKGPFLTTHSSASFIIDSPTIPDSGFSTEFE